VLEDPDAGFNQQHPERGVRALPQPEVQVEERDLLEMLEHPAMADLGEMATFADAGVAEKSEEPVRRGT
jgi:hypothetical protein